jgi:hypothetical protein
MIIAEDLVLLLYADATGKAMVGRTKLDYALAGALLGDLANAGRVDVARTHLLIAILAAINAVTKVIESPDEGDLKSRAKSLAQGVWPADAVRKAQRDELVDDAIDVVFG